VYGAEVLISANFANIKLQEKFAKLLPGFFTVRQTPNDGTGKPPKILHISANPILIL